MAVKIDFTPELTYVLMKNTASLTIPARPISARCSTRKIVSGCVCLQKLLDPVKCDGLRTLQRQSDGA